MPSIHDSLMADAAGLFQEIHGERDDAGREKSIEYRSLPEGFPITLAAILTRIQFEQEIDRDQIVRIETRTARVLRSTLEARNVTRFEKRATVTVDGEKWNLREQETQFGAVWVTFGLVRKPLVEIGGNRGTV